MSSTGSSTTELAIDVGSMPGGVNAGPTKTRSRKAEKTRLRLRESAVEAMYELGYENATIDRIVLSAGLTKGSFYHHFTSKEELLAEIHNDFMDAHLEELRGIAASTRSPADKISLTIHCLVAGAKKYQKEEAIFFEEHRKLRGDRFREVKEKRDEFRNILSQFISEGMEDGTFRTVPDAKVMSFGIVGMASWTYLWINDRGLSPDQIADMYAKTVLEGLLRRDAEVS